MYTYEQTTGHFSKDGQLVATGYSGFEKGHNNPALQQVKNIGPIPRGRYTIGTARDTDSHGPVVMPLTPCEGTNDFERSGFLMHGDSVVHPGGASHGCIILNKTIRIEVSKDSDKDLEVVL